NAQLPGREVAGKTGTTDGNKSAWFVGYTPQLSTAISMFRYPDDESIKNRQFLEMFGTGGEKKIHGASFPSQIWADYMQDALKGQAPKSFPTPEPIGEVVNDEPTPSPTPTPTETETETPSAPPSSTPPPARCGVCGTVNLRRALLPRPPRPSRRRRPRLPARHRPPPFRRPRSRPTPAGRSTSTATTMTTRAATARAAGTTAARTAECPP